MSNATDHVKKIATICLFEKKLVNGVAGYYVYFVAEDDETYRKYVSIDSPHWQKMFFNMGQTLPDFNKVEPLIGNKVELVIGPENTARYVNRLSTSQLSGLDYTLGFVGQVKHVSVDEKENLACWDKVKKFFG